MPRGRGKSPLRAGSERRTTTSRGEGEGGAWKTTGMTTLAQAQAASPASKDGSRALVHASEGRNRLRLLIPAVR